MWFGLIEMKVGKEVGKEPLGQLKKHSSSSRAFERQGCGAVQPPLLGGRSRLGSIFRDGLETAEDSSWGQVGASR